MYKIQRVFDYIDYQLEHYPNEKSISHKVDGQWKHYSTATFKEQVNLYSAAFYKSNIRQGDTIAMISSNRPEWNFCDNGMMQVGAVNVPIYPTSSAEDYIHILNHAAVKMIFVSDQAMYNKVSKIKDQLPTVLDIFSFDPIDNCLHVSDFLNRADMSQWSEVESIKQQIKIDDLATIIYTSGTTGAPKGVMLSHRNIIFNVEEVVPYLPLESQYRILSFLPLCHIFERVVTYLYFYQGLELYYAESLEKLKENISEVKPHFFTCVPRLMEKIYDGIILKGQDLTGIQKIIYHWAINLAHKPELSRGLQYKIADKLVFSKWREALGGNIKGIVTGAAALPPKIGIFFNNAGIVVREGYGMTETSPVISFNRFPPYKNMPGTVGEVLDHIEVKLEHREGMDKNDGEILVKGENVMLGYFNNPEATKSTIVDGWLYTGDIGRFVDNQYLKITDRAKELFKTSGGKYIAPQYIENTVKESKYIEQIIVIGNNRKFISALIYPSKSAFENWTIKKKIVVNFTQPNWTQNKDIEIKISSEIERFNQQFGQVEKIKRFKLINNEWTIDSGELTPTLKLKRKIIEAKYSQQIEDMYKE